MPVTATRRTGPRMGSGSRFVKRENTQEQGADQAAKSLISNIYLVNVQSGELTQITSFTNGRAETPHWSPDGNTLAFNTVLDGRMEVQIVDIASGEIQVPDQGAGLLSRLDAKVSLRWFEHLS